MKLIPCDAHRKNYSPYTEKLVPSNISDIGYDADSKACQQCMLYFPEYAKECKGLTEEWILKPLEANMGIERGEMMDKKKHKFVKRSKRGVIFGLINEGKTDNEIITEIMGKFGFKKSFARAKLSVVKKLMTEYEKN